MPEEEHNKMMGQFQEKVFELGFTMKCKNGVYGIYLEGMRAYSLHKRSYKYNRHLYAKQTTDDRLDLLEIVLYNYFGPGGKGSSLITPKKAGDQNEVIE
ncbi:hypothetical protein [Trichococcus patagoniensis]|uniref:hypothetical protein n=1 Tax=Trichococcus patagoniensis TaxID=382641 RepID=UPI000D3BFDFD|nr:hypothetical protein [Trichococcus patagoniensis]